MPDDEPLFLRLFNKLSENEDLRAVSKSIVNRGLVTALHESQASL